MTTFATRWHKTKVFSRLPSRRKLSVRMMRSLILLLAGMLAVVIIQEILPVLIPVATAAAILTWRLSRLRTERSQALATSADNERPVPVSDPDNECNVGRLSASTIGFVLREVDMSLESRQELTVGLMSAIEPADMRRLAGLATDTALHSSIRQEIAAGLLEQDLPGGLEALASLMTDEGIRGQDRLMAASALLQHGDERAVPGLWMIVRWPNKDEAQPRLDAAMLLNEAEQDRIAVSPQSFRALEYIANDPSITVQVRMLATDYLLRQGHHDRAIRALWNLVVEPKVSGPMRLDLANRLRGLDAKQATGAYRTLAYDASLALPLRFRAAEQLRIQSEADGERAFRDLSYTPIPSV